MFTTATSGTSPICIDITGDDSVPPTTQGTPTSKNSQGYDEVKYMDNQKRLTDAAIDRFCMASCTRAMMYRGKEIHGNTFRAKPLGWIRSLSVTRVLSDVENPSYDVALCRRKLGLENHILELYDTVMISLHGGDHWSLMVCYVQTEGIFNVYHYDSMFGAHIHLAETTMNALISIGVLPRGCTLHNVCDYPQQKSYYECGYSVLMMVGTITSCYQDVDRMGTLGTPRIPSEEFPSLDERGVQKLWLVIYRSLGKSTTSYYPSERVVKKEEEEEEDGHSPSDDNTSKRKTSLVSHYHRIRSDMLGTLTPVATTTATPSRPPEKRPSGNHGGGSAVSANRKRQRRRSKDTHSVMTARRLFNSAPIIPCT